jgi:formylglycine-generating enzyme required for sulfatase activity
MKKVICVFAILLCVSGCALNSGIEGMVFVQGGTYTRGCTAEQGDDCERYEFPAHEVTLSDFYIGKYEVTQAEWVAVMGENPSKFKGDSLPVSGVSWNAAHQYIAKLNEKTGRNYRLPTQAEWEYAARGGALSKGYKYSGSNDADEVAWYAGNAEQGEEVDMPFGKARRVVSGMRPVGQKKPNELGIYDMSGNISEWCSDFAGDYDSSPVTDPVMEGDYPVYRGGNFLSPGKKLRVSYTGGNGSKDYDGIDVGFRLAHSAK